MTKKDGKSERFKSSRFRFGDRVYHFIQWAFRKLLKRDPKKCSACSKRRAKLNDIDDAIYPTVQRIKAILFWIHPR